MTNTPDPKQSLTINDVEFTHADIERVVQDFYSRVAQDPVLKVPFASVQDWPHHIARLTHFWWVKFGGAGYMFGQYDPVTKHFFAGFNAELLKHWLGLFEQTLKDNLKAEQAALWLLVANRMGHALTIKNEMFKAAHIKP
jgi:hemoglobin